MSTWSKIVELKFYGNAKIAKGDPKCIMYAGNPNGVTTAPRGTLSLDNANSAVYINTDGTTAWSALP